MKVATTSKHHPLHSRRREIKVPFGTQRFLAMFEGLEGGFAIGASVILALSFAHLNHRVLLITAFVSILVNGFNNASVKYSSEHYLDQIDGREKKSAFRHYFIPSAIEFVAYLAISFLSILPILLLDNLYLAIAISIVLTLVILFVAGYWRAYMLRMHRLNDALETMLLGASIMLVGLISGYAIHLLG